MQTNVVYSCKYHVMWCPKYCCRVLTTEMEERIKAILREVAEERQADIIKLEIMSDFPSRTHSRYRVEYHETGNANSLHISPLCAIMQDDMSAISPEDILSQASFHDPIA
ncbi:transposase [Sulfoacidibacillus thermotolerans]|uniref:transposase n=1 Tax=Sulfoacidibacillus thermotolerans TaxID=1765684 RepID=UPI000D6986F3